jgi:hypothetical protein
MVIAPALTVHMILAFAALAFVGAFGRILIREESQRRRSRITNCKE